jgi:hypothetical protein
MIVAAALAAPVLILVNVPAKWTATLTATIAKVITSLSLPLAIALVVDGALVLVVAIWWLWWRQGWRWLIKRHDPLTWAALRARLSLTTLPLPRTNGGRLIVASVLVLALFWYASGQRDDKGVVTYPHASLINPILGGLGALVLIYAAIRQAQTASSRHEAQTKADLQRRITETFSKAVEQLGNEKMAVRIGGIYTLERLASEALTSPPAADAMDDESTAVAFDLYRTVMETLAAFVSEQARSKGPDPRTWLWPYRKRPAASVERDPEWDPERDPEWDPNAPTLPTDIVAALDVIVRRPEAARAREEKEGLRFNLIRTDLRHANLQGVHLKRAQLRGAHLENAHLRGAHLQGASLRGAHLQGAFLQDAHLEGTFLGFAHLERAHLEGAHLQGDRFRGTHLEGTDLGNTNFDNVDLSRAKGDEKTRLPAGFPRPPHWPPYKP